MLSTESTITLLVAAGAIIGLGYIQSTPTLTESKKTTDTAQELLTEQQQQPSSSSTKKKSKKKSQKSTASPNAEPSPPPSLPEIPSVVIPGSLDDTDIADVPATTAATPSESSKGKKMKKKKMAKAKASTDASSSVLLPAPADFEAPSSPEAVVATGRTKKAKSRTTRELPPNAGAGFQRQQQQQHKDLHQQQPSHELHASMSIETDGSWTRVGGSGRRGRKAATAAASASEADGPSAEVTTSDAGITTPVSVTGTSSPVARRAELEGEEQEQEQGRHRLADSGSRPVSGRRPLAERLLLLPKAGKTGVEDMLETPDVPPVARVMRIQPRPGEKPATGFSWGDYEDVEVGETTGGENDADGEDDGWGVVPTRRKPKPARATATNSQTSLPSSSSTQSAPETLTKRQRQNAKRHEAAKAEKVAAEKARLATLANHKRSLEKERTIEQLSKSGGKKAQSGGMKAVVDNGRLVWE